jgi:hypothetical protein
MNINIANSRAQIDEKAVLKSLFKVGLHGLEKLDFFSSKNVRT